MGVDGSVAYLFEKKGVISFPADAGEDRVMEAALEAGAEDIVTNPDHSLDVLVEPEAFLDVKSAFLEAGLEPEYAQVTMRAMTDVAVDQSTAESLIKLTDTLEDLDDVQDVYSNADISDEILAALG
jgi:transcriptional/translational regulatory protein YebC/TACO1